MNVGDEVRILAVDDAGLVNRAWDTLLPHLERHLDIELDLDRAGSYDGVAQLVDTGGVWDVAFVDLDLGVGSHGGLSVLDLLASQEHPPRLVVFTEPYDPGRTLALLAAWYWFEVEGVMNKIGSFDDDDVMVRDFVDLLTGALAGAVARRWIPPHCDAPEVEHVFKLLLPTGVWYQTFCAMRSDSSAATAAAMLNKTETYVRQQAGQAVQHIPGLWTAIKLALERSDRAESAVFQRQIDAYTRDLDGPNKAYPVCYQFARSQELFFMDPYVAQRAKLPPRGFHHRGPIASFNP